MVCGGASGETRGPCEHSRYLGGTLTILDAHGMRTQDNMKNWCGIKGEEESAKEAEKFEGLIVENAKRLQDMGKTGLIILPGVKDILESVSIPPRFRSRVPMPLRHFALRAGRSVEQLATECRSLTCAAQHGSRALLVDRHERALQVRLCCAPDRRRPAAPPPRHRQRRAERQAQPRALPEGRRQARCRHQEL